MRAFFSLVLLLSSCTGGGTADSVNTENVENSDNATLRIQDDDAQYYLRRCKANKNNDTIFLNFSDTVKHANYYALRIIKVGGQYFSNLENTFSISDSSYRPSIFTTFRQAIKLDKSNYEIGDSIKGSVSLDITSYNQWPEVFQDTLKIAGGFKAKVY